MSNHQKLMSWTFDISEVVASLARWVVNMAGPAQEEEDMVEGGLCEIRLSALEICTRTWQASAGLC